MKRGLILLALLAAVAAVSAAAILGRNEEVDRPVARITLDGRVVEEIDLSAVEEEYRLTFTGESGHTNTVLVQPGRVCVEQADCPDQICVKKGFISNSAAPIVCMPNHLIIEIRGGGGELDALAD